jgi:prolyl 4-hydroxylase
LDKLNASPQGSDAVTTPSLSYYGLEDIQLVKYLPTQYFFHHVDWFDTLLRDTSPKGKGRYYNRVASFFLYLQDDCTGGETEFPDLHFKTEGGAGQEEETEQQQFWRERVDLQKGISFKPRTGSGIFWVNLLPVGYGDERVRHAGLPVQQGNKMGMNIWVKRDFGW